MDVVLTRDGFLSWPKLLVELGCLAPKDLDAWRRGRVPYLERVVRMNLTKLSRVQTAVRRLARERGLLRRLDAASPRHPYSKTRNPVVEAEYGMVYRRPPPPPVPSLSGRTGSQRREVSGGVSAFARSKRRGFDAKSSSTATRCLQMPRELRRKSGQSQLPSSGSTWASRVR